MQKRCISAIIAAASGLTLVPFGSHAFQGARGQPTPQQLAAQQATRDDHQQMMEQLHIASLRPGVNARVLGAANYDDAKANPYPDLPELLTLKNGKKVTSAKMWWSQHRPEIVEEFDPVPKSVPKVKWEVVTTANERVGDTPVVTRTLVGHVDNYAYPAITVDIQLSLSTPAGAKGLVPVIMVFGGGFGGRGAPPAVSPAQQGAAAGPSWQAQVLARGWGFASLNPNTIQADNGAGLRKGMIGLVNKGEPRKPDDCGALRAWAWGTDRAMDYLESDKVVASRRVGIQGHSRYGKAAIVSMAYDPRIAIAFVSSSGEGGAKLHRRNFGELVENVASENKYHWMAGNFLKYAGPLKWSDLPVDSHELIAMCAPRPVFLSAGNVADPAVDIAHSDAWGQCTGNVSGGCRGGAGLPSTRKEGPGKRRLPACRNGDRERRFGVSAHSAGHTPNPNWPYFLGFAEREFKTGGR